jgi:plasmid maintenance system antidote protein VapI
MSKTNFSKVEEALSQGLIKLTMQHLFDLADAAAEVGTQETTALTPKKAAQKAEIEHNMLVSLRVEMDRLYKKNRKIYATMGIKRKDLEAMINETAKVTPEQWTMIHQVKNKLQEYRKKMVAALPQNIDEKLIEQERKKHINKRFNVNDKWLPLK